jgi:hypothetical protein
VRKKKKKKKKEGKKKTRRRRKRGAPVPADEYVANVETIADAPAPADEGYESILVCRSGRIGDGFHLGLVSFISRSGRLGDGFHVGNVLGEGRRRKRRGRSEERGETSEVLVQNFVCTSNTTFAILVVFVFMSYRSLVSHPPQSFPVPVRVFPCA